MLWKVVEFVIKNCNLTSIGEPDEMLPAEIAMASLEDNITLVKSTIEQAPIVTETD
jgi:hypothetical protein